MKIVSELKKELQDLKSRNSKQIQKLSRENTQLKKRVTELQKQVPAKEEIIARALKSIDPKISSLKKQMMRKKEFDSALSKNEKFNYMLEHFSHLDRLSMTRKQYAYFSKQVDKLRKEAASLASLKKELEKLSRVENDLMKLSRRIPKIERKIAPVK